MKEAAALYVGRTVHQRFGPRPHRFAYKVFQLLLDVDRLGEALNGPRLLRQGRFGLFSFEPADHGFRDGSSLRAWAEDRLARAGVKASATRIRLLCFPRILGFVFNPISVWFVHGRDEALEAVIYEVNNTFGQTHAYVLPAAGPGVQRQRADKRLYVSPFYKVEGEYRFAVSAPGDAFHLDIVKAVDGRPDFTASLHAHRESLTDARLMSLFLGMPLMTLGVVAAIHWEALRLLLKKAPFGARPPGPDTGVSAGDLVIRQSDRTGVMVPLTEDRSRERPSDGERPLVPVE
jgi:DUF1365 family protein